MGTAVSIIIPIYNCQEYLPHCIESVKSQTFSNWELILVDDGSSDASGKICDTFAEQDDRIVVRHIENAGPSQARNVGLASATGKYLLFMDSDDYIETNALAYLQKAVDCKQPEIVFYANYTDTVSGNQYLPQSQNNIPDCYWSNNAELKANYQMLNQQHCINPVWNKMYLTSFVKGCAACFPKGVNAAEDLVFNMALYPHVNKTLVLSTPLYHYVNHPGSICGSFNPNRFASCKKVFETVAPVLEKWNPNALNAYYNSFLLNISICINNLLYKDSTFTPSETRKQINTIVRDATVQAMAKRVHPVGNRNKAIAFLLKRHAVSGLLLTGKIAQLSRNR